MKSKCLNNALVHAELITSTKGEGAGSLRRDLRLPGVSTSQQTDEVLDDTLPLNFWEQAKEDDDAADAGAPKPDVDVPVNKMELLRRLPLKTTRKNAERC